jgi:hypothetical protein
MRWQFLIAAAEIPVFDRQNARYHKSKTGAPAQAIKKL